MRQLVWAPALVVNTTSQRSIFRSLPVSGLSVDNKGDASVCTLNKDSRGTWPVCSTGRCFQSRFASALLVSWTRVSVGQRTTSLARTHTDIALFQASVEDTPVEALSTSPKMLGTVIVIGNDSVPIQSAQC